MPNDDTYLLLRRKTGEVDVSAYTNADLEDFLTKAAGDVDGAAALIWREKAAAYADLTDTSEAGSSRKDAVLYDRAIAQAAYFESRSGTSTESSGGTTTRRIVRA